MSKDTRSPKSRLLVAGAAGLMIGMPLSLSSSPVTTDRSLHAADPAPRHAQSMLQLIVDRESRAITSADGGGGQVMTVAGQAPTPAPATSPRSGPEFQQQYGSEVQRQLQQLYQQDGRTMPDMPFTPVPHEALQHYPTTPKKMRLKDVFNPSAWKQRFSRPQPQPQQTPPAPITDATPSTLGPAAPLPQTFTPPSHTFAPPPAPAVTEATQRPQLQRYSPEIFDSQTPSEPVPAPASTAAIDAEQPGFFPGAAPAPAPVVVAEQPRESEAAPPLLIILPETQVADAAEQTPYFEAEAASTPAALPAEEEFGNPSSMPPLETVLTQPGMPEQADVAVNPPAFGLVAPGSDALAQPFPVDAAAEPEPAGPYTGLGLDDAPYEAPELASPSLPGEPGAFAAPAQSVEPAAPQIAAPSPLRPAADHGPVLIAPGSAPAADLPLVQPARAVAPTVAASSSSSRSDKQARIAARTGLTGFKGFCPVMLRDYRELADSRSEHSVVYQGRQFWFSSDAAKQVFLSNPGQYIPAGGGIDPVVYRQSGQTVDGSLDHAVWYHGQLYLFSSQVTKAEFVAAPRAHAFE